MKTVENIEKNIKAVIERVSSRPFYSMHYYGNYHFDEYLKKGARDIDEFVGYIIETVIHDGEKQSNYTNFGCGVFVAKNTEGDIILARNMDCECAIPMLIRLSEGPDYKSMALVNMAELEWDENTYDTLEQDVKLTLAAPYSPADGINEYGLAVSIMTDVNAIYPNISNKVTIFDYTLPRLLLNKAKSVDEAIELAGNYNFFCCPSPLHFIVADSTGDAAVIEFVNGEMVVMRKDNNYQVVTNFTLYNNPNLEGFGKDRYENIDNELKISNGIISEKRALELLKSNVIPGDEQWSAIYNLTKKSLTVTFSRDYNNVFEFKL